MSTPTIIIENVIGKLEITGLPTKESEQIVNHLSDTVSKLIKDILKEYEEDKKRQVNLEAFLKDRPFRCYSLLTSQQSPSSLALEEFEKQFHESMDKLINQSSQPCKENQHVNEVIHSQLLYQSTHLKLDEIISLLKN